MSPLWLLALGLLLSGSAGAQQGPVVGVAEKGYDLRFDPETLDAPARSTLTFQNDGQFAHTFTFVDGETTENVDPGASATLAVPDKPGTYAFVCRYHAETGMKGTLRVLAAGAAPATTPASPSPDAPESADAPPEEAEKPSSKPTPAPGLVVLLALAAFAALLLRRR